MNTEQFFQLSPAEQERLVRLHSRRHTICEESARIKRVLVELQSQYATLQNRCEHPAAQKTHRADDGYDYKRYWTEYYCPDCDKRWTKEGSL